jgi:serine/threonine protein phosphatase PrpC
MKVPANVRVGASTHAGLVRGTNEDDYLVGALGSAGVLFAAVADGMGGLAGGAEASRTALRAAAAAVLDPGSKDAVADRVRAGFTAAAARVHDASVAVPALRDMGTTLTVLCVAAGVATVGHVGDTRLYRMRGGRCEQLTIDHAVREPDNLLTRCIGAGQPAVGADHASFATAPADRFVLVSDGVWSVLTDDAFARLVERGDPQAVADALVEAALAAGGPDNATAVVVDVRGASADGVVEQPLPRDERRDDRRAWPPVRSLRAPLWPWLLVAVGLLLAVHAGLRWLGVERGLLGPFG